MKRCLLLAGLVCCGGGSPQAQPITVTATGPEGSAASAPSPVASPDGRDGQGGRDDTAATDAGTESAAKGLEGLVRSGPVTVTGKLAPEDIQSRMTVHLPAFAACQKTAITENGASSGTLRLRIVIDATGQVASAGVTAPSTLKNDKLARCVLQTVRGTAFPRPSQGTVEATYSLVFASGAQGSP